MTNNNISDKLGAVETAIRNNALAPLVESRQQSQQSERSSRLLDRLTILSLWDSMGKMYGPKWESSFGTDPDPGNIWAACLCGLEASHIAIGFAALRDRGIEWPPSAPEFRNLCLGKSQHEKDGAGDWEHKRQQAAERAQLQEQQPLLALPNKTQKELWREKQKAKMRQVKNEVGLW